MRVDSVMPHNLDGDGFIEYQILQGMTVEGYWLSVQSGQEQAEDWEKHGHPIPTAKLTDDQKGWAKADHCDHYQKETARWRIPFPARRARSCQPVGISRSGTCSTGHARTAKSPSTYCGAIAGICAHCTSATTAARSSSSLPVSTNAKLTDDNEPKEQHDNTQQ